MIKFTPRWDTEIRKWLKTANQAFVDQFGETAILKAIADAEPSFRNYKWCKNFIDIAMDPFDSKVVWIEQGTHQPEDVSGGGFKLHFTGRDNFNYAFHFYVKQAKTGALWITEMTYYDNGIKHCVAR